MPLRLSISLSRKVGEANYGSRGATVGLELEAEASLVQRLPEFQEQVAHLFRLARESVDRELAKPPALAGNGVDANGTGIRQPRALRAATANQVRAIHVIAEKQGLDLRAELLERFGVAQPSELSLGQASALIAALTSLAANASDGDSKPPPVGESS